MILCTLVKIYLASNAFNTSAILIHMSVSFAFILKNLHISINFYPPEGVEGAFSTSCIRQCKACIILNCY